MKIALGTVQWGLDYGISNINGIPSDDELKEIISTANKAGINMFDTAVQYGNAEKRLGEFSNTKSNIVTKIGSFSINNNLKKQLKNSFKNFQREKIYGCLFHNCIELKENKHLWEELLAYKKADKINKIGYSLYEPSELLGLLELGLVPDIVQVPYSILDRKFEPYFELLKEKGVEIHVRSVFLQGLLFKKSNDLSPKMKQLKPIIDFIYSISTDYNISVLQICLGYALQKQKIDHVVVGIDNIDQLKEIIQVNQYLSPDLIHQIEKIQLEDNTLLNPSTW